MKLVDYFILLISCMMELYLCHYFFDIFFEQKNFSFFKKCLTALLFMAALFGVNLFGNATLNIWIIPVILFLYLLLSFKVRILQGSVYFICVFSILAGSEFLFVILAETTSKDSALTLSEMPWQTLSIKLISFIVILMMKQIFSNRDERIMNKIFWMYLCLPIASLGMMFTTYFINIEAIYQPHVKIGLTLTFTFMLFGNIIVFVAFNRYGEALHRTMQQEWIITKEKMNRQYYQKIADLNDKRQEQIHNLKHYITGLKALLLTHDNDEALKMITEIAMELEHNERSIYSKVPFLDIVLTEKKSYADENDVTFDVKVEPDVALGAVKKADYIVMLGNLLDNAIQAASCCAANETPEVSVKIFMENRGAFLVSKITNNFVKENLKIKDNEFITTKKESGVHGIGIKSVRKTAQKCSGTFLTNIDENLFTAILTLPVAEAIGKDK